MPDGTLMKKVHLQRVDGGTYCSVNNGHQFPEATLLRSPKIAEVTCKLCIRRYTGQPITKKVVT